MRLGLESCGVCTVVRSPKCRPRDVHPLADLLGGMPRRTVDGWPGITVVVYVDCSSTLWPGPSRMVEDESSRTTNSDMLRLGWMIRPVGCSCNPLTSCFPRVRVRVATVSRLLHPCRPPSARYSVYWWSGCVWLSKNRSCESRW